MACEEVREGESVGSPAVRVPQGWVLTATPSEARLSPATPSRDRRSRVHADSTLAYHVEAK